MPPARSQSILVVEDEGSIASFIGMYLKKAGFGVRVARTGTAAIEEAGADVPALIVLDLMLPDLDGIGYAAVSRRGSLLVRVGRGRISVTDLPGGSAPSVSCDRRGTRVSSSTVVYQGRRVSCRVFGGPWKVRIKGRNIDADGVVAGYLTLDREGTRGLYSIDGSRYRLWPATRTRFTVGNP